MTCMDLSWVEMFNTMMHRLARLCKQPPRGRAAGWGRNKWVSRNFPALKGRAWPGYLLSIGFCSVAAAGPAVSLLKVVLRLLGVGRYFGRIDRVGHVALQLDDPARRVEVHQMRVLTRALRQIVRQLSRKRRGAADLRQRVRVTAVQLLDLLLKLGVLVRQV